MTAAATFGTSLAHLAASPRQQGWTFDVVVGNSNDQTDQVARDAPFLERNPYVGGFSAIASPPDTPTIDGHGVGLVASTRPRAASAP